MPTTDQTGLINQVIQQATATAKRYANSVPTPYVQPPSYAPGTPQITGAQAQQATTTKYDPVGFSVDKNQTVAGNIENLIAKDSPLMQQAATRAKQYANSRGLINSGLAAQAGQEAVIAAAMPIAQQDASTYNQAHTNTQNAKNASLQFGAQAQNTTSQTNAQLGTNVSMENAQATNAASLEQFKAGQTNSLAEFDARTKLALAQVDANTRTQLATIDGNYRQLLQTNQDAASAFNQVTQNIANISQNSTMSQEAKDRAIATQMNSLNELLRQQSATASTSTGAIGELNLGSYFGEGNFAVNGTSTGSGAGSSSAVTTPGATVTAFGRQLTIGPSVAPNTSSDTTRFNEAKTNGYPYWLGSDGFAYPIATGPGVWPSTSFNGQTGGTPPTETPTGSTPTGTPTNTTTPPPAPTGSGDPYALGFTQTNGQWEKQVAPPPTVSIQGNVSDTAGYVQSVTEVFGKGFVGAGGMYYASASAAAASFVLERRGPPSSW